jgi:glutaredoxin
MQSDWERLMNATPPVEVYWMPGCTSCLRMKEYIESTGVPHVAIDVAADRSAQDKIRRIGARVPCTILGDRWADGADLGEVARLIGVSYDPPVILPTAELAERYRAVNLTLQRLIAQADAAALGHKRPERDRTLLAIAYHAASVMRWFLHAYDPGMLAPTQVYAVSTYEDIPSRMRTARAVAAHAAETLELFEAWWARDGQDDPLDRVEPSYWGHHTLLEIFEREVWHSAQHTRQVAMFLDEVGIRPDRPLGDADLAGLPMPEGVFA